VKDLCWETWWWVLVLLSCSWSFVLCSSAMMSLKNGGGPL
jgi:hypothetical protein